jgi:hypothetical protein
MLGPRVKFPVPGSNNSVELSAIPEPGDVVWVPPAISTLPFDSSVALCPDRSTVRLVVVLAKVPVEGSYSSAKLVVCGPAVLF